jgi:purine-binding chemotaxis protein CheW
MTSARNDNQPARSGSNTRCDYITVLIGEQNFGIPVGLVQDVFMPQSVTRVPLAPREVAGILNLRGRIVTAIDLRRCLDLPAREPGAAPMAVGIEKNGEAYGLVIDQVGEVLSLNREDCEPNPANLEPRWREVSRGVYRLDGNLLVVLDVDRILDFERAAGAA